ncbi:MAG: type 4a pilus biogenesis protein PilO [Desulfobacterales bacterium]|nr:type 4a pilus biogenesis protein PilO [Desulfobacterales bacterium]
MDKLSLDSLEPLVKKYETLTKVQRIVVFIAVVIVLAGLFYYFSFSTKLKNINALTEQYKNIMSEIENMKVKASQLEKKQKELKEREADFQVALKALPEKNEIPLLLTSISQSGQEAGLEFLLFQPMAEAAKEFYAEIPVSISVSGGFHDVAIFFDKVSQLSRIVTMRDIKMTVTQGRENTKDGYSLTTGCSAVTYKFIEAPKK